MQHQTTLKRILRYLSETRSYSITYIDAQDPLISFKGYSDAAYADQKDKKSTMGYVYIAAGGAITWRSGKQGITTQSTTEAEYIALWEAGKEASWLCNLYKDLLFSQRDPTMILCDNTGAVAIVKNSLYHKWTKHIDLHYHWICKKVQLGRFEVKYCSTADQTANIMTKPLPRPKYIKHMWEMGISTV